MKHFTLPRFWQHYHRLPVSVQQVADTNYVLLEADPFYPSLHFKKVGRNKQLWPVRVGEHHRALGFDKSDGAVWFWIGTHAEYDKLLA